MDIEKSIRFFLFAGLAVFPIAFALFFFNYERLCEYQIIKDFGITKSLITISLTYTGISIIIRVLMYSMGIFFKDKTIFEFIKNCSFLEIFYVSCVDTFLYSSIPIIITFVRDGDFISFIKTSVLILGIILLIWTVWFFILKNKLIVKK